MRRPPLAPRTRTIIGQDTHTQCRPEAYDKKKTNKTHTSCSRAGSTNSSIRKIDTDAHRHGCRVEASIIRFPSHDTIQHAQVHAISPPQLSRAVSPSFRHKRRSPLSTFLCVADQQQTPGPPIRRVNKMRNNWPFLFFLKKKKKNGGINKIENIFLFREKNGINLHSAGNSKEFFKADCLAPLNLSMIDSFGRQVTGPATHSLLM